MKSGDKYIIKLSSEDHLALIHKVSMSTDISFSVPTKIELIKYLKNDLWLCNRGTQWDSTTTITGALIHKYYKKVGKA